MKKNAWLIVGVILLALLPLFLNGGAAFEGADGQAEQAISQLSPHYQPWFNSIWEPPSGEIESLLFALQAALGAGFIGYFFGFQKGKKASEHTKKEQHLKS